MAWSAAISWIVLRPLIASMATLALNSGLWVRRLLNSFGEGFANGGAPFRGGTPPQRLTMGPVQKNQTTSRENGFAESFNGRFRDQFLNIELFTTAPEAQILADCWRWEYNTLRPHSALQGLTPLEAAQQGAPA
jgi:hypothetical protein